MDPDKILKFIKERGEGEIALVKNEVTGCNFEGKKFKNLSTTSSVELSCRVLIGKKQGFSSTTNLAKWKECVERAFKVARSSRELDLYPGLPATQKYGEVKTFSIEIERFEEQEMVKVCEESIEAVLHVNKWIKIPSNTFFKACREFHFWNTNGIEAFEKSNSISFSIVLVLGKSSFWEAKSSRRLDFNPVRVSREAAQIISKLRGRKKLSPGTYDVIFEYFPASSLLEGILVPSVCADEIQKNRSFFAGKLGEKVANEELNVIDDGTLAWGVGTSKFDAEGVRTKRKFVLRRGTLKGFLYDHYTARREEKESTGNCSFFLRRPSVWATNFIVEKTKVDVKKGFTGIVVKSIGGSHLLNPVSGDFSINIDVGFFYKNGELKYPVKGSMIVGNLFNSLKDVEVGNDPRQDGRILTPSIKFKGLRVVS